jgi:hypothetical protein
MVREIASQFGCGEEVKAQHDVAAVTKLDFALVSAIIVFEMMCLLNRIWPLKANRCAGSPSA